MRRRDVANMGDESGGGGKGKVEKEWCHDICIKILHCDDEDQIA